MIYVSKRQIKQVEYLISQSLQGNHILFDIESLRQIFWKKDPFLLDLFSAEDAYSVEHHLEKIIFQPSLAEKRAYLDHLDPTTFARVVKTYFNIVENNLFQNKEIRH